MARCGSIAPGPAESFHSRPYWLTPSPPIHGPPPGGVVNHRRGRMVVNIPGAGVHGAAWRGRRVHESGGYISLSRCRNCAGGRPHGGGAFAVYRGHRGGQDGGEFSRPGAGQPSFDSSTVPYESNTVKKNRYTFDPKNGQNGISRKAQKIGKNQRPNIQYYLQYAVQ